MKVRQAQMRGNTNNQNVVSLIDTQLLGGSNLQYTKWCAASCMQDHIPQSPAKDQWHLRLGINLPQCQYPFTWLAA